MRKFKKGFTIVELVIVIAVIAVLTAVLVPTFINLTNKANESADESNLHNMNTLIVGSKDLAEAKKKLAEGNMNPEATPAIKDRFFAWDDNNKEFLIAGEKSEMKDGKFTVIRSNSQDADGVYTLGQDKWERLVPKEITLESTADLDLTVYHPVYKPVSTLATIDINQSADIDFGYNAFVGTETTLNVNAGQDKATINISGSGVKLADFNVTAPNAEVNHAKSLTISTRTVALDVAPNSYNLFGALLVETKLELVGSTNLKQSEVAVLNVKDTATVTAAEGTKITKTNEQGQAVVIPAAEIPTKAKEESKGVTVSNEAELRAAVSSTTEENDIIIIADNIALTSSKDALWLARGKIIYGGGYVVSSTQKPDNMFLITGHFNGTKPYGSTSIGKASYAAMQETEYKYDGLRNLTFEFHGVNVQSNGGRGITTTDVHDAKVIIDNCEVSSSSYGLNLHRGSENLDVEITSTKVHSWGAINSRLQNSKVFVKDSVFTGVNTNSGTSNDFCTICIDGDGYFYRDVKTQGDGTVYNFENSEIQAKETTDTEQNAITIQCASSNNTVNFTNCNLKVVKPENRYVIESGNTGSDAAFNAGTGNKIIVDGNIVAQN